MRRRHGDHPEPKPEPPPPRTTCPYDGAVLLASGICSMTGGYPYGAKCPFVCPICRHPLRWSGICDTCFGQHYADDQPTAPGDWWDLYDTLGKPIGDGLHWIFVAYGPQKLASREEVAEFLAPLYRITARGAVEAREGREKERAL